MGIEIKEQWRSQVITAARAYSPNRKSIRLNYDGPEGWILERKVFDKDLAKDAARAGATVVTKAELLNVERGGIGVKAKISFHGKEKEVEAKLIVAADGVESRTARMLGLDTTMPLTEVCSCAQFEMTNIKIDPECIDFFFEQEMTPGGYFWIFPKGKDSANVGLGVRKPWSKKLAIEYLEDFVESMPNLKDGSIVEVNAGAVPVGQLLDNMVEDNLIVVGDAAHQVNPIHGGGIAEAYIGGNIAGGVILAAFKAGDFSKEFLKRYNERWWEERGTKLKKILKLRHALESMSNDDLNWIVDYLDEEDIKSISKGANFAKLAALLIKKPKLIMIAKKLM
jgi:digeranylgeranylglycerophospholipid reductase